MSTFRVVDWNMSRLSIGVLALLGVLAGCQEKATPDPKYYDSIRAWQEHREKGLRSPNGWLTLVGLFWLKPGDNTIGSADTNDLVLPKGSAPPQVGKIRLAGDKVTFIRPNGSSMPLSYDADKPDTVQAGTVSFFVIKRLDRFGVRAKDSASPVLKNFAGSRFFPINPELHFHAKFIPDARKVPILNIVGQTEMQDSPGLVEFS